MDVITRENMLAAMHGEAFAYARYSLFAKAARENGDSHLAGLFDGLAEVELHEHFAELAELAGIVGSDADNLKAAIQDEDHEVEVTYPYYSDQARTVRETAVAERFAEIAGDEREHMRALETALEGIGVPA